MRARSSSTFLALTLAILFVGSYLMIAKTASAVGSAADAMCNPVITACPCGQIVNPKGGCMAGSNMFMCPCFDTTNGFTTTGQCIAANKCLAQSTSDNKGPDSGLQQLMGQLNQLMQQLMQSSSGGSGSGSGSGTGTGNGCTSYTPTSNPNSTDPCTYYAGSSGSTTSDLLNALNNPSGGNSTLSSQLLGSLVGTNSDTGNSNTNSNTNSNLNSNTSDLIHTDTSNTNATAQVSSSESQNLKPGTSAAKSQTVFGSISGTSGDIQVLSGNHVTILASSRDIPGNKQTSGFYGFGTEIGESTAVIYAQICSSRPWSDMFINFIIPASYLDNLCASHGYAVGPAQLAPAVVATPTPKPTGSLVPKATSTPPYLGPMKADIWTSPTTVHTGSKTSVFWSSSGVLSCSVKGTNNSLSASTLSGNAASQPLSQNTTFTITCESATSSVSNQTTVTVQ